MLSVFTHNIRTGRRFNFIKVGDGELDCMRGHGEKNCDGQPYSSELAEHLVWAFTSLCRKPHTFFGDWFASNPPKNVAGYARYQFFHTLCKQHAVKPCLLRPFELLLPGWGNLAAPSLLGFYAAVQASTRNKVFVGPEVLRGACTFIRATAHVVVPKRDAWVEHERIIKEAVNAAGRQAIVVLACGPMSPVVANHVLNASPASTVLDVGSGFDPLFIGRTRGGGQARPAAVKKYFHTLLSGS